MKIINFLLGKREFSNQQSITDAIKKSPKFTPEESALKSLLVFENDTQKAWLIFTPLRMYYVLDDTEKETPDTLWARDTDKMSINDRISLHIKTKDISKTTGTVHFGNMNKGFMYTKSLFKNSTIDGEIYRYLGNTI